MPIGGLPVPKKGEYYAYLYLDPRTGVPFYVGKGTGTRFYVSSHVLNDNKQVTGRIRILDELGLKPVIQLIRATSNDVAVVIEKALIAHYGRKDKGLGPLFNHTDGGDGAPGHKQSEEHKAKIAAKTRGKKRSPETLAKISATRTGMKMSAETCEAHRLLWANDPERRAAFGARWRGIPKTAEQREKCRIAAAKRFAGGYTVSPETKEKLSAATKAYWERKKAAQQEGVPA